MHMNLTRTRRQRCLTRLGQRDAPTNWAACGTKGIWTGDEILLCANKRLGSFSICNKNGKAFEKPSKSIWDSQTERRLQKAFALESRRKEASSKTLGLRCDLWMPIFFRIHWCERRIIAPEMMATTPECSTTFLSKKFSSTRPSTLAF